VSKFGVPAPSQPQALVNRSHPAALAKGAWCNFEVTSKACVK